jgi:sec-independent protein translocase protein TatA
MLAEIIGPDILIIVAIIALLFGGSQVPKLARGLGSASHEFRKGLAEGQQAQAPDASKPDAAAAATPPTETPGPTG